MISQRRPERLLLKLDVEGEELHIIPALSRPTSLHPISVSEMAAIMMLRHIAATGRLAPSHSYHAASDLSPGFVLVQKSDNPIVHFALSLPPTRTLDYINRHAAGRHHQYERELPNSDSLPFRILRVRDGR